MRTQQKDYIQKRIANWTLLIKKGLSEYAEALIREDGEPLTHTSRSVCHLISLPNGKRAFRKLLRHGGLLAPLLGGLYFSRKRIFHSLDVSRRLKEVGLPSPEVLAVGWRTVLPHIYSLLIVTEWLGGATPLSVALGGMESAQKRNTIKSSAELLRLAFECGIEQTDMHLDNILINKEGVFLSDVETIRLHRTEVPLKQRLTVLLRLGRAVVKRALYPEVVSLYDIVHFLRIVVPDADAHTLCSALQKNIRLHSLLWRRTDTSCF